MAFAPCTIPVWLRGVSLEDLYVYLADLRAARLQLAKGGRITSVSYEGKSVSYSSGEAGALFSDMRDVLNAIAVLEGNCLPQGPVLTRF
jgi:hypothetical protein